MLTEHPLPRGRSPGRQEIPSPAPRGPPSAAPSASASQWAPNYWAARCLPAFQGPLSFSAQDQHTHPKSLLNCGLRLFFLSRRSACSKRGLTGPECRVAVAAAPHAQGPVMGWLPPVPAWLGFPLGSGHTSDISQYLS